MTKLKQLLFESFDRLRTKGLSRTILPILEMKIRKRYRIESTLLDFAALRSKNKAGAVQHPRGENLPNTPGVVFTQAQGVNSPTSSTVAVSNRSGRKACKNYPSRVYCSSLSRTSPTNSSRLRFASLEE